MKAQISDLRVTVASDGVLPLAFSWRDRVVRVAAVEDIRALRLERRYRVLTTEGSFELGLDVAAGSWRVLRAPSWLSRARARLENMPRYPLPASRRRARPVPDRRVQRELPGPAIPGGNHASRLALVRQ